MSSKLVSHALATPNLLPVSIGETLLLLSIAKDTDALQFLQGDGKKWTNDIEVRRIYIDLLRNAGRPAELRDFCQGQIDQGVDDWKIVQGWIDGHVALFRSDHSQGYYYASKSKLMPVSQCEPSRQSLRRDTLSGILLLEPFISRPYFTPTWFLTASARLKISVSFTIGGIIVKAHVSGIFKGMFQSFRRKTRPRSSVKSKMFLTNARYSPLSQSQSHCQTPLQKLYRDVNYMKFDYMLRPWRVDSKFDLIRCWEVYLEGLKHAESEPAEDADDLPGDDALLLGCYTLVKAYNATSISISIRPANLRTIDIPPASRNLS